VYTLRRPFWSKISDFTWSNSPPVPTPFFGRQHLPKLTKSAPTAVQMPNSVHDTADRLPPAEPGLGMDSICHVAPFQRAANGMLVPAGSVKEPTAVQSVENVHDTPESELYCASLGIGVDWIDHALPFQRSARVTLVPALLM
jgi:hypothetical protein